MVYSFITSDQVFDIKNNLRIIAAFFLMATGIASAAETGDKITEWKGHHFTLTPQQIEQAVELRVE